jgi:hypothetical protein
LFLLFPNSFNSFFLNPNHRVKIGFFCRLSFGFLEYFENSVSIVRIKIRFHWLQLFVAFRPWCFGI